MPGKSQGFDPGALYARERDAAQSIAGPLMLTLGPGNTYVWAQKRQLIRPAICVR
ncbi:hypothetical protein MACH17_06330 [Phaeobacter inhibens]|nr:hypothetical protein MACH17_06330 [Phaeobacter inhibens]